MDDKPDHFLERLIGAALLLTAAVVFVPILLDDSDHDPDWSMPPFSDEEAVMTAGEEPPGPAPFSLVKEPALPGVSTPVNEAAPDDAAPAGTESPDAAAAPGHETAAATETKPPNAAADAGQETAASTPSAEAPKTGAWVVQTGGFSQRANADARRDALREGGYRAFLRPAVIDGQDIFLVQIGPFLSRDEAESLRDRLYSERQVKGIIKKYP